MQYGHCVVSATATAINCLCKTSMAPSFERLFVKSPKGFHRFRCILIELLQPSEIFHIKHVGDSILVLGKALPTMRGMGSAFGYTSQGFNSDSPKRTGMAKFDPPNSRTIAKLIPITLPSLLNSGPPEPPVVRRYCRKKGGFGSDRAAQSIGKTRRDRPETIMLLASDKASFVTGARTSSTTARGPGDVSSGVLISFLCQ